MSKPWPPFHIKDWPETGYGAEVVAQIIRHLRRANYNQAMIDHSFEAPIFGGKNAMRVVIKLVEEGQSYDQAWREVHAYFQRTVVAKGRDYTV